VDIIKVAIIEKSPFVRWTLERAFLQAGFQIVINTASIRYFLLSMRKRSITLPDICLLDTTATLSIIDSIKQYKPKIKVVAYDPVMNGSRASSTLAKFDASLAKDVELEQWINILQVSLMENNSQ
jgi:DNA-binding NtrC family response regulator